MQIKSINHNIKDKMLLWLNSITDEKLRSEVKNNLLVSGGCITSLLLKEDVKDYDVYIKDMDVLFDLAMYYTHSYDKIRVLDGRKKEDYLLEFRGGSTCCVKHIVIENLKPEQVKLSIESDFGGLNGREDDIKQDDKNCFVPLFFSPNAISLTNNVQIVTRFHGDNEEIHKNFDFIHATNYFTFKDGLVTNKKALESILTKQLYYQGSLYPITSIIRMKKFIKRNWNINAGEIFKIMFQISELDLKDYNVLEDQLIGVDVAYFSKLIEVLRNLEDKMVLTSAYLNEIIDRIFGDEKENNEN